MAEIIGIDHIYISVSDMEKSVMFYDIVMDALGFKKKSFSLNDEKHTQYFNRYFGYVLKSAGNSKCYDSGAPGMHHFCFRTESVEDVYEFANLLSDKGIEVSKPKYFPEYAEDYFAIYFYDPDGLMLEITNYRDERRDRYHNWKAEA